MSKHYNARVRHRDFQVGDLVLRKIRGAAKDPSQGKLGPNWEGPYRITSWQRKGTYELETMDGRKFQHLWNTEHLGNTTSRNDIQYPPYSPVYLHLLVFWLFFGFLNKPCYNDFFSTFLSPRGQVLFSTALNFMEENSDFAVLLLLKDYYHQWTDPTRVSNLYKSTKWTDSTKGQNPNPQSGRTTLGS